MQMNMTDKGGMNMPMPMSMSMWFHFGTDETILFKVCKPETTATFILSLFIIYYLAVAYEALKWFRYKMQQFAIFEDEHLVIPARTSHLSGLHLCNTLLYTAQVALSYCLMLIFMTYNVWLGLAVVLGSATGHFLFAGMMKTETQLGDHCHQ